MFACVNLFSLQGQCRTQFRFISLDISNFVSFGETLTYISLLLNLITKNKDINNITILMNIIYEASILLLTIMKCYQCKNNAAIIQNKNTSFVCILKLWYLNTGNLFISVFTNYLLGIESSCYGICLYTILITLLFLDNFSCCRKFDQISWNACICTAMVYISWMSNKMSNYDRYL